MNRQAALDRILNYFSEPYSKKKVRNTSFKMNFFFDSSMISFLFVLFLIISFPFFENEISQYLSMTFIVVFSILTVYLFKLSMKTIDSVIYTFPISPNIILKKYIDIDLINSNDETRNFYNKIMSEREMYVFEYNLIKAYISIKNY
jgi:hypothetical protein